MAKLKGPGYKEQMTPEALIIESKLNSLFSLPRRESEERKGLHASAIIASDNAYCLREQVLSLFFKRKEEDNIPDYLKRIFEEGNCVHEKWQGLFERAGIAIGIEDRGYSLLFDLYMTPDAIIKINNKVYVVEIKSANTFAVQHMTNSHPSGTKQLQLYMHFLCIPRGFVLVEDKNTQEIKVFPSHYEPGQAKKYIERLYDIKQAKEEFIRSKKLPSRCCRDIGGKRAHGCAMAEACFNIRREKIL